MNLNGQPGELRFSIEVTRKETGKVEKFDLIGKIVDESEPETKKEEHGSHTQHSSS